MTPEYDFDGRAYTPDGVRWPDMDAPIFDGEDWKMRNYIELPNGERKPVSDWVHEALVRLHGWVYIIREENLNIIRKLWACL